MSESVTISHILFGNFGLYAGRSVFLPILHDHKVVRDVKRMSDKQRAYWKRRLLQDARNLPFGVGTPGADSKPLVAERGHDVSVTADNASMSRLLADPINAVISLTTFLDCPLNDLAIAYTMDLISNDDLATANVVTIEHKHSGFTRADVEHQFR